jgi:hypothetical protein
MYIVCTYMMHSDKWIYKHVHIMVVNGAKTFYWQKLENNWHKNKNILHVLYFMPYTFVMVCCDKSTIFYLMAWKSYMMMCHFSPCHINLGPHNIHLKNLNFKLLSATCGYSKQLKPISLKCLNQQVFFSKATQVAY